MGNFNNNVMNWLNEYNVPLQSEYFNTSGDKMKYKYIIVKPVKEKKLKIYYK